MTKLNPSNGNKRSVDIFSWNIFKSNVISFYQKILKCVNDFQNLNFMTKVNKNIGNETKSDIFPWIIFKSDIIFHRSQSSKLFQ